MTQIFLFDEVSYGSIYGVGTYIKQVAESLYDQADIKLHLINIKSGYSELTVCEEEKCTIIYIPQSKYSGNSELYYKYCWYLLQQFIIPTEEEGKIVFHINYLIILQMAKFIKETFPNSRIFYTIHYQDWAFQLNGNFTRMKELLTLEPQTISDKEIEIANNLYYEKALYLIVDKIICLSHQTSTMLEYIFGISQDVIRYIPNGLKDEYIYLSLENKKRLKKKLFFKNSEKIIIYVGRIVEIKNLDLIIRSFRRLLVDDKNCHLLIVGDGVFQAALNECKDIWRKITFTGRISKQDLYNLYQIADVGIMLSREEQCSYVAIEMMMFNIPLVFSNSMGLNEMIEADIPKVDAKYVGDKLIISEIKCKELLFSILNNKDIKMDTRSTFLKKYKLEYMQRAYLKLFFE